MSRGTSALFVTLAVTFLASCEVAPGTCTNGVDTFGRGPERYIVVTCTASGNDLSCTAKKTESGYCAGPDVDATKTATWASSDASVAVITSPGAFHVIAEGQLEVTAKLLGIAEGNIPQVWMVSPVSPPERLSVMQVGAKTPNGTTISGVQIDVIPQQGPQQHCVTPSSGTCIVYVFRVDGEIRGTKTGYADAQLFYLGNWSSLSTIKILTLTPN